MSTTTIKGVKPSDGTTYQIDYNSLANRPTIPSIPSYNSDSDEGKVLTVGPSDDELIWESISIFPSYDAYGDHGKVLTIANEASELGWASVPSLLDVDSANSGDVLVANPCGGTIGWASVPSLLDVDSANSGDVLVRRDDGTIGWATPVPVINGSSGVINWDYHD